jgi:cytochrome c-type biogenesis protein CcmE
VNNKFLILVGAFVFIGALMVFQSTRQGATLVLLPSQVLAADKPLAKVRVAGRVAEPIEYQLEPKIHLAFKVHDPGGDASKSVRVEYAGIKPDMFSVGRDVIIDGEYTGGNLKAVKLLTQCPSKYEAPDPAKMYTSAAGGSAKP